MDAQEENKSRPVFEPSFTTTAGRCLRNFTRKARARLRSLLETDAGESLLRTEDKVEEEFVDEVGDGGTMSQIITSTSSSSRISDRAMLDRKRGGRPSCR